jgi:CHAT domain-containing protein
LAASVCVLLPRKNHHSGSPISTDPKVLIAEADRLFWLGNLDAAGPAYSGAEQLFHLNRDSRNEIYARVGALRSDGTTPLTEVSRTLANLLQDPVVKADLQLRLWCITAKGYNDFEIDSESAKRDWVEALSLANRIGDSRWAYRSNGELGLIAFVEGDTSSAVSLVGKALLAALKSGDVGAQIEYLTMAGIGFNEEHRFSEALPFFKRAISTARNARDAGFPYSAYEGQAAALLGLGKSEQANELLLHVLSVARTHGRRTEEAQTLLQLGDVSLAIGNLEAAKAHFTAAANLFQSADLARGLDEVMFKLAGVYREQGRLDEASKTLQIGLRSAHRTDRYYLPRMITALAELQASQGRTHEAKTLFEEAEDIIDGLMVNLHSDFEMAAVAGAMSETYVEHFKLAVAEKDVSQALRIVERARGHTAASLIREERPKGNQAASASSLDGEIANLQGTLLRTDNAAKRSALLDRLLEYERSQAFEDNEATLNRRELVPKPAPLRVVKSSLRDDELLLEYVLDDRASYCIAITNSDAKIFTLDAGRRAIEDSANSFLTALDGRRNGVTAAKQLYAVLLDKVLEAFPKSRLIIATDGVLHRVPFEALQDATSKPLVMTKVVSYTPSASALVAIRKARRTLAAPRTLLAVGSVDYKFARLLPQGMRRNSVVSDVLRGLSEFSGSGLEDLPASRDEVLSIAHVFDSAGTVVLLGTNATESAFKKEPLSDYRVIHLAVHSIPDPQFPYRASLVLGADPEKGEDGLLQVREITRMRLNADLVTLSACETGIGPLQGEAGMASLQQAFLTAGARAVVASLWRVEDHSTTALMKAFYAHLAADEDKALALANAKRDVLKKYGELSPYYWASFVMAGEGAEGVRSGK